MSMSSAVGAYWLISAAVTSTARCHTSTRRFDHRRVTDFTDPVRVNGSVHVDLCLAGSTVSGSNWGAGGEGVVNVRAADLKPASVFPLSEGESSIMAWREGKDERSFDAQAFVPGVAVPPLRSVEGDAAAEAVLLDAAGDVAGLSDVQYGAGEVAEEVHARDDLGGRQRRLRFEAVRLGECCERVPDFHCVRLTAGLYWGGSRTQRPGSPLVPRMTAPRRPKPSTLRSPDLHPPALEPQADVGGAPSLDRLDPRRTRSRLRRTRKDRLTARQRVTAASVLAALEGLDRAGASDEEIAAAAGVPVEVIREWRYPSFSHFPVDGRATPE